MLRNTGVERLAFLSVIAAAELPLSLSYQDQWDARLRMNAFSKLRQVAIEVAVCLRHLVAVRTPLRSARPYSRQWSVSCLWNPTDHHSVHKNMPVTPTLRQISPGPISLSLPCQQPVERHGSGRDGPGFYCTVEQEIFLTSRTFCMPWGPPSLLFNEYWGSLPGVRRPGRHVNRWPSSSAKVKNKWGYTYTSLYPFTTWTGTTLPVSLLRSLALRFTDQP